MIAVKNCGYIVHLQPGSIKNSGGKGNESNEVWGHQCRKA